MEEFKNDIERVIEQTKEHTPGIQKESSHEQKKIIKQHVQNHQQHPTPHAQGIPTQGTAMGVWEAYEKIDAYNALPDTKKEVVRNCLESVRKEGIVKGIKHVSHDIREPSVLDAFHDVLVDVVLEEMKERKLL